MKNPIRAAIKICGQSNLARACGVTHAAVYKWGRRGLPHTEWSGTTRYSEIIERETGGQVTVEMLLATRPGVAQARA